MPVCESHVLKRQDMNVAVRIDGPRPDQAILRFAPVRAGVHAQCPSDRAGNAAIEGKSADTRIGRRARNFNIRNSGSGAQPSIFLDLDLADGRVGLAAHALVQQPRGVHHQQAGAVDRDPGVGDALAVAAEVGDRLAEGRAGHRPRAGELERALGQSDRPHAVVDATRAEPTLGDLEGAAGAEQHVGQRHAHVGERHLAVAERFVVVAHRGEHPLDLHARGVPGHEHHRVP